MNEVSRILSAAQQGDRKAAEELLPHVYEQLRELAAAKLANEPPGQTLQATALVHDAYLRLTDGDPATHFNGRGHFFAAAAESMRRILVERARRKRTQKMGGDRQRIPFDRIEPPVDERSERLLAVHEALDSLQKREPLAADLVKLRYFVGLGQGEAAEAMGISRRTADRLWAVARTRLLQIIGES